MKNHFPKINLAKIGLILAIFSILIMPLSAVALTSTELYNQRNSYTQQLQTARQQELLKQQQAAYVADQISKLNSQIADAQRSINQTQSGIDSTQTKIDELKAQITAEEGKLKNEKSNLSRLISEWYMEGGDQGLAMQIISSDKLTDVVTKSQYYSSIKDQITTSIGKIKEMKAQLEVQKSVQDKQLADLTALKNDQLTQKKVLDNARYTQKQLLSNTQSTINQLKADQADAQKNLATIQAKIDALSGTKIWGTQIVSSNDGSWYYSQTGNYTHLGNSPYTVSQYGCLITSMAMVATFYGNNVTPSDIASNTSIFDDEGYLLVSSPPGLGVIISGSQGINWSVVNQEIDAGHPVIVSIYLPSVGAINADGSSHFIVIKARSGDKYLMHDPISGQRGYDLSQVRSMKIVRPY